MRMRSRAACRLAAILLCTFLSTPAPAASGEMGTGVPQFAVLGDVMGAYAKVTALSNATVAFPAGCSTLFLTPATLGMDTYKIAIATMLSAAALDRKVRFYAHATRDGGCGVDYVEMVQ